MDLLRARAAAMKRFWDSEDGLTFWRIGVVALGIYLWIEAPPGMHDVDMIIGLVFFGALLWRWQWASS
jgi:hypothetical protein